MKKTKPHWMTINPFYIIIILLGILFLISYQANKNKQDYKEQKNLIDSLNDTIKIWKDKDSLSHSKISVIETDRASDFLTIETQDKTIKELQGEVKKYKKNLSNQGSVTIVKTETEYDTIYETKESIKLVIGDANILDSINNTWINSTFGFTKDSTIFNLKVKNDYTIVIGEESQGLFKAKKPFVEVINKNPYSETKTLRTYQVSLPEPKRFGLGPIIGYGLTDDFNFKVFLGLGLQYNIIRF